MMQKEHKRGLLIGLSIGSIVGCIIIGAINEQNKPVLGDHLPPGSSCQYNWQCAVGVDCQQGKCVSPAHMPDVTPHDQIVSETLGSCTATPTQTNAFGEKTYSYGHGECKEALSENECQTYANHSWEKHISFIWRPNRCCNGRHHAAMQHSGQCER